MRHEGFEAIRVSEKPVDHVAAVGASGSSHAVGINVGKRGDSVNYSHEIVKRLAAPIRIDFICELLAIACGPARVRHNDDVACTGEHLRIPTIAPALAP